jgi:hypothetical protein
MTQDTLISKVRKLLQLSTSSNANEAALAAAKAQELIDRHNLSATMLALEDAAPVDTLDEPIQDFYTAGAPLDSQKTAQTWRGRLAVTISRLNGCRVYTAGGDIALVGRPTDAETVRYLYGYITREIERLTNEFGKGMGTSWRNNFRLGAVQGVKSKLYESRKTFEATVRAEASSTMALMRVDRALARIEQHGETVERWTKENLKLYKRSEQRVNHDARARETGRQAGRTINVNAAKGALGSGQKRLS